MFWSHDLRLSVRPRVRIHLCGNLKMKHKEPFHGDDPSLRVSAAKLFCESVNECREVEWLNLRPIDYW